MKVKCVQCGEEKLVRKEVYEIRVDKVMKRDGLEHDEAVKVLDATYLCRGCRPKTEKLVKEPKAKKAKAIEAAEPVVETIEDTETVEA